MNTATKTRGILIDPHTRTVSEVTVEGDTLAAMYAHIGCKYVQAVHIGRVDGVDGVEHDLWIDEEGVLCDWDTQAFFRLKGMPEPLAGRGLIFASNDEGDTLIAHADITPELVQRLVVFVEREGVEITAPTLTTFDADGNAEVTQLAGVEKFTYSQQP